MMINSKKTKAMIFNFTDKYQFSTRLSISGELIEVIDSTKLLGTIITSDLRWEENTAYIVQKANASFGTNQQELRNIYILFVRSQLEQSAVVWHSSLTDENKSDLERVQRSAMKIILGSKYQSYKKALDVLDLETLDERREYLKMCCQ